MDLFKNFRDRRVARQYKATFLNLDANSAASVNNTSANSSMDDSCASIDDSCTSMDDSVASEVKQVSSHGSLKFKDSSPTHYSYTAEQLLQKRNYKEKCNGPQAFFSNVMKDAAIAAALWKNPPASLEAVSSKKKELFFTLLEKTVPQLRNRRNEVWRRLGQRLQNRRKYIKDILTGKRKCKTASGSTCTDSETSIREAFLNPGDTVNLKSKIHNQTILGTGIYLGQKDQYFSEVVVKTLNQCDITTEDELPEGASNFKSVKEKTVITYWSKYISKKTKKKVRKRKTSTSTSTVSTSHSVDEADSEVESVHSLKSGSEEDLPKISTKKRKKKTPTHNAKLKVNEELLDIDRERSQLENGKADTEKGQMKKQQTKDKKRAPVRPSNNDACGLDLVDYTFVLMEWGNRSLYWGIKKFDTSLNDFTFVVQSCTKSCGKIKNKTINFEAVYDNSKHCMKLSNTDLQLNPDMSFCVCQIKKDEFFHLEKNTLVLKAGHDEFISKLKESFSTYISE